MAVAMALSPAPSDVIYRIARGPEEPFALPDWERADPDGTFGNRFDDPGALFGILPEHRFRVIYCATQREAAFGEVFARFRQRPGLNPVLAQLRDEDNEESLERTLQILGGGVDPDFLDHASVESDWLQRRRIGVTKIIPHGDFVDISHPDSLAHLNQAIAPLLTTLGMEHLDLSSMTDPKARILTQYASRYIYRSGFAGIRYTSRLGTNWECWALFEGRFQHEMGYPGFPENIHPDDVDLLKIGKLFGISIEIIRGMGNYLRPWQD